MCCLISTYIHIGLTAAGEPVVRRATDLISRLRQEADERFDHYLGAQESAAESINLEVTSFEQPYKDSGNNLVVLYDRVDQEGSDLHALGIQLNTLYTSFVRGCEDAERCVTNVAYVQVQVAANLKDLQTPTPAQRSAVKNLTQKLEGTHVRASEYVRSFRYYRDWSVTIFDAIKNQQRQQQQQQQQQEHQQQQDVPIVMETLLPSGLLRVITDEGKCDDHVVIFMTIML